MMTLQARKNIFCISICKAFCCRYIYMDFDKEPDQDDLKFFMLHNIKIDSKNKHLIVPCKCNWLTNQNKCKMYPWKPLACTAFECDELKKIT